MIRTFMLCAALLLTGCGSATLTQLQAGSAEDQAKVVALANATNDSALSLCATKLQSIAAIDCTMPDGKTQGPACSAAKAYEFTLAGGDSCAPLVNKVKSSVTSILSSFGVLP